MSVSSKVWYKTPVGLLQLGSLKGQKTSGGTTDPFWPSDRETVARMLKDPYGLGRHGAGSQAATFRGESVGNGAAHPALRSDPSEALASPCLFENGMFLRVCPLWTLAP